MTATTDRCSFPHCPLYVASHDARLSHLGCVDDIAEPCRVERGEWQFDAATHRLVTPAALAKADTTEKNDG